MQQQQQQYNLDIESYTVNELLALFDIPQTPTLEHLNMAKKKMLMMHPDKSRMPPEYFRFYKSAFDRVLNYYKIMNRQNQVATEDTTTYRAPEDPYHDQIRQHLSEKAPDAVNRDFNVLFEQNVDRERLNKHKSRTDWFRQEDHTSTPAGLSVRNVKDMDSVFDTIRTKTAALVVRREIVPLASANAIGGSYFEDDHDEDDEAKGSEYYTSNPFSTLCYDDIRRVHKDETVIPVGIDNRPAYKSVEEYQQVRSKVAQPISATEAERLLEEQERVKTEQWKSRWSQFDQRLVKQEKQNDSIRSSFLMLR